MEADGGFGGAHSWQAPAWAVRLRRGDGTVAGAGVLIEPEWVLTSACVVARGERVAVEFCGAVPVAAAGRAPLALGGRAGGPGGAAGLGGAGAPDGASGPGGAGSGERAGVGGVAEEVRPVEEGGVALVRLDRPGPQGAATPLARGAVPGRRLRVYGFPRPEGGGAWSAVAAAPRPDTDDGRVALVADGGLARGYAGAGAADAGTGRLAGVVLPGPDRPCPEGGPGTFAPYLCPAESVVRHLPRVLGSTLGRRAVDARLYALAEDLPGLVDPAYARRLADWFRGDAETRSPDGGPVRHGDGSQVKVTVVRPGDRTRQATLLRAVLLADRELRPERTGPDPAQVPPPGCLDLAADMAGRPAHWLVERIADRLGLPPGAGRTAEEAVLAAPGALVLAVTGVDDAADPDALLDLLAALRTRGDRLLLVFRRDGEHFARAWSQLVIEPSQQRQAAVVARLTEVVGPLAARLEQGMAEVEADCGSALRALSRAESVLTALSGAAGAAAGLGLDPVLGRYDRAARRAERRLREAVIRLSVLVERRDETAGLLSGYQALYKGAARQEDLAVEELYQRAAGLLAARPCDVAAAGEAVGAYVRFVEEWLRGDARPAEGKDTPS